MIINIHAGHNPDGKVACGAVGLIKESTEARAVKNEAINLLKSAGHAVYDCTCDTGRNQSDVLAKIVEKCNAHKVDLDVSIHFNSGAKDKEGNGQSTGVEVLVFSRTAGAYEYANDICKAIAALGFKSRGVKSRPELYVLRKTTAPALLIECCFVDDADDVRLYDAAKMAQAIVKGITGQTIQPAAEKPSQSPTASQTAPFLVKVTAKSLYIRKGPGTNYSTVGAITDQGTYTIIEEKNGWGFLKSERGWISLNEKYANRI